MRFLRKRYRYSFKGTDPLKIAELVWSLAIAELLVVVSDTVTCYDTSTFSTLSALSDMLI